MGNIIPNNLTELKMFLQDEHIRNKPLHSQLKRQFEHHLTSVEPDCTPIPDVPTANATAPTAADETPALPQDSSVWQSIADTLAGAADLDDVSSH